MVTLSEIKPRDLNRIYDLVQLAGIDVRDWANGKGGKAKAASNPKYCFEWSYMQAGKTVVLNLWHPELQEDDGVIAYSGNLRRSAARAGANPKWRRRALNMDHHIQSAYVERLPVRVVLLDGQIRKPGDKADKPSRARQRTLDPQRWAVTEYDWSSGEYTVTRGASPIAGEAHDVDEEAQGFEGELRRLFILHRNRERKLRQNKLKEVQSLNGGRLVCEVPNCEFDFRERYGELGEGFAHVHHLAPLAGTPKGGRRVYLHELAVVCANCHAMIHRGGQCRPLEGLIPS